jgi:flagellar L-ring protein precursor FlgH
MTRSRYFILCIALILMTGCASVPKNTSTMTGAAMVRQPKFEMYQPPKPDEGSLWAEASEGNLFTDIKARHIGDVITVRIVEDPQAKLDANTKTSRSSSIDAAKLKFLGYMKALADKNPNLAQNPGTDDLISASFGSKFDGQGSSDRDGHVQAYISAVVEKVLYNGNLYIRGNREIRVNNETQYITISGIVRPEDISSSNEVSSTYVADANITYSGSGPLADKQQPGWLGRILDHVWPF